MDDVHGNLAFMKRVPAGEFKQHCLRLLDEVRETGHGIVVTKRGTPVAQVVPLPAKAEDDWAGAMRGTGEIVGDLVSPATEEEEWEALRS